MSSGLIYEIFSGWKVASMISQVEFLGAGRIVDANIPVRVSRNPEAGTVMGNPFLVWSHLSLMSEDGREVRPGNNLLLWQSVNNEEQACMRTLGVFARLEDEAEAKAQKDGSADKDMTAAEFAFIAAALRMFWGYRADLAAQTAVACKHFALLGKIDSCDGVWGKGAWKTLPVAPPRDIRSLSGHGHKIGQLIREWHDDIFTKFRAVEAWPIAAKPKDQVPFQSAVDRGADVRAVLSQTKDTVVVSGNEDWQSITLDELEKLVWTYPRQQLAALFGVTDMAIYKKCKKNLVPQPPRGFWQKVKKATRSEMTMFLVQQGVKIPKWWDLSMSKDRMEELDSVEGVRALIPKRESVDS